MSLFDKEPAIDQVHQVRAGKFRRYSGMKLRHKITDIKTIGKNVRDSAYVLAGYRQAHKLIKDLKPDGVFIKGGYVGVPVGLAAARLKVPIITHDSDSTPGLANRIIARWATVHATGMPAEYYDYPKDKTVFIGIPVTSDFKIVNDKERTQYRDDLGLADCQSVITLIGGSQGAEQLNNDMVSIAGRLMHSDEHLGIIHVTGLAHERNIQQSYNNELLADERRRVVVRGFVTDMYRYSGAADVVITRAGANATSELAIQRLPIIVVPGRLASGHQDKNARILEEKGAAIVVAYGDSEGLYEAIQELLKNTDRRQDMAEQLHLLAKPHATKHLAELILKTFSGQGR